MRNHDTDAAQGRPIWVFMAATAMATTISTLAATAMVKAEATEPVAVTCACDVPTPVVVPAPAPAAPEAPPATAAPEAPPAPAVPRRAAESNALDEMAEQAAAPKAAPKAEPKASVEGALDKNIIRRVVKAHIDEVRYCYNEGLEGDPELAGRVAVQFVIGPEGKVTRSTAESDMEGEVPECIAKAVQGWLFPKPRDGKEVAVSYPFVLEPG